MSEGDRWFTDLNGKFEGWLFRVRASRLVRTEEGFISPATRFTAEVHANYNKDLMKELREGLLLAVRNFKAKSVERYTLFEVASFVPEHFGLEGLSDKDYYPLAKEVTIQAVPDWERAGESILRVHITAIPINYDLIISEKLEFERGWSQPIVGEKVKILNPEAIAQLYNGEILKEIEAKYKLEDLNSSLPTKSPRLGVIEMFPEEPIPVLVSLDRLIRYHYGVFAYTGGGKSNLVANIIRRIIHHTNSKVIIFDISSEYTILLLDLLLNDEIPSLIVLEEELVGKNEEKVEQFYKTQVKPDTLLKNIGEKIKQISEAKESDKELGEEGIKKALMPLIKKKKVKFYTPPSEAEKYQRYKAIIRTLSGYLEDYRGKGYNQGALAVSNLLHSLETFMKKKGLAFEDKIGNEFLEFIEKLEEDIKRYGLSRTSLASLPQILRDTMRIKPTELTGEHAENIVQKLLYGDERLIILNITTPSVIRNLAIEISQILLQVRKREFRITPYILSVFDEAQEFIPKKEAKDTRECSEAIEILLRQGRKYGLGVCIASQRIAGLNTDALQQLHTYFVGTLPRPYDRILITQQFAIPTEVLDLTLEFGKGQWLLSSYNATGISNVPIFIRTDNSEDVIVGNVLGWWEDEMPQIRKKNASQIASFLMKKDDEKIRHS